MTALRYDLFHYGMQQYGRFMGRWDHQVGVSTCNNTSSAIKTTFTGTGIAALFDLTRNTATSPQIKWQVDGGTIQMGSIASSLTLASGLAAGTHTLTIWVKAFDLNYERWNPPIVSAVYFKGFTVTGGVVVRPLVSTAKRIQYLGDSITEGLWILGVPQTDVVDNSDGVIAWPAQIAMNLGCDWRQTAFGGQGIAAGGVGNVPAAGGSLGYVYAGIADDNEQPDLVVINFGANDIAVLAATYQANVLTYLAAVRAKYPLPRIVYVEPFGGAQAAAIAAACAVFQLTDGKTTFVNTSGYGLVSGDYNGGHPNITGTAKIIAGLQSTIGGFLT